MFCLRRLGEALAIALLAVAVLASDVGVPRAQDGETAEEVFHDHISESIIQSKCIKCHVEGGLSGNIRLVFVRSADTPDHEARNLRTLQNLLDDLGGSYILNKIQGVSHGGGPQVLPGSADFANMERFLGLLGEEIAFAEVTLETLFDTVVLASPRKTLRRAALIFAGRIPTDEEYAAVEGGDQSALRATIRGLMEGPQFHEFLIRASNDRPPDRSGRRAGSLMQARTLLTLSTSTIAARRPHSRSTIDAPGTISAIGTTAWGTVRVERHWN